MHHTILILLHFDSLLPLHDETNPRRENIGWQSPGRANLFQLGTEIRVGG